jgi:hypothetical protein
VAVNYFQDQSEMIHTMLGDLTNTFIAVSPRAAAVGALGPVFCDFSEGTFARRLEESPHPFEEVLHGCSVGVGHPRRFMP